MQKAQAAATIPFQSVSSGLHPCQIQLFDPKFQPKPGRLRIHVLYTNSSDARTALEAAVQIASGIDSEIALIVPHIVPFPLPLQNPPVPLDFVSERIRRLAESVRTSHTELRGHIYLCRNPIETLIQELPAHSLVVIGVRPLWPFYKSKRVARALRRNGHEVIVANYR